MKKWSIFIVVVGLALFYGLVIRERQLPITAEPEEQVVEPPIYTSSYAPSADAGERLVRREVVLMGSRFLFVVDAPEALALRAITRVTQRLRELESSISSWRPGSDIYLFNQNAGDFVTVGSDAMQLLQLSRQLHRDTDGAFDVTIGAVWDLYPFRDPDAPLPTDEQISEQLNHVGADRIVLRESESKARIPVGMSVNLGGIGKGYAASIAIEMMREMGVKNAAVSAGGDLYLMGKKSSGPWNVRIENPRWEGRSIEQFSLGDLSVATSGDSQRYIIRNGQRYGHIIDPLTGRPARGAQSVTVITENPILADAYATAVFVKGAVEGMAWVNAREGVEALIVDHNGAVSRSNGWLHITGENPS